MRNCGDCTMGRCRDRHGIERLLLCVRGRARIERSARGKGWHLNSLPLAKLMSILPSADQRFRDVRELGAIRSSSFDDASQNLPGVASVRNCVFDENKNAIEMTPCDVLRAAEQLDYQYEGEPTQVLSFCGLPDHVYFAMPLWDWSPIQRLLTRSRTSFGRPLPPSVLSQVQIILTDPTKQLYFEIEDATADVPPGATWEVYFGLPTGVPPDPTSPFYVGKLAMFGNGIRSGAHFHGTKEFKPADFEFNVTRAMAMALQYNQRNIPMLFVSRSILVNGRPEPPKVEAPISFTKTRLAVKSPPQG